MTSKTELQESNEQFIAAWAMFAQSFPNPGIAVSDHLAIGWPDVPLLVYNNIFVVGEIDSREGLTSAVDEAVAHSRGKKCPGMITVCHDLLSGSAKSEVEKIFAERGYGPLMGTTGMAGNIFPLQATGHPDLRMERVEDGNVITELNCDAYHMPREVGYASILDEAMWKNSYAYVGYIGDRPVATATTMVTGDTLYLALVAAAEDVRNKGYGSAVVRYSLQKAYEATGLVRTVLHATADGYPVYKRIGYEPVAKFTSYAPAFPQE
ncbi:putative N-acetyltransferase YhbS [Silvibacterium bohemicum]|uniref:Putative N-acetyltransferase YhbS n=1 Tax=Silvibacterium bohemicum TaxID=1577686 RepID=A0A841JYC6_9BACT|nr:GNAT family N-acetyltransferase [Silvibacterium bohemicum]MBB6145635.1 putative N-acetyltransferase YhbS [Silvibacterium bohemicum]